MRWPGQRVGCRVPLPGEASRFGSQERFRLVRWLSGGRSRRSGSVWRADDVAGAAWPLGHDERPDRVARTGAVAVFSVPIGVPAGRGARWFAARLRGSTVSNHWRRRLRRDKATRLTAFNVSTVQTQEGLVPAASPHELAAGSAGPCLLASIVKPTVRNPTVAWSQLRCVTAVARIEGRDQEPHSCGPRRH